MRTLQARDERQAEIDRAGDRLAYLTVSFALLVVAAYRGFVADTTSWDLLGIVVLGGVVGWTYRATQVVVDRRAAVVLGITITVAAMVAVALALVAAR